MTNQTHTPAFEDDGAVDLDSLFEEIVLSDGESERDYLRTQWIERALNQLVSLRVRNNLTQRQLGERIGKPQSSIARIEAAADMKLSVLWDYLSGMGLTTELPLQIKAGCPKNDRAHARTAVTIDENLLTEAQRLTELREAPDVIREALKALIERESARRLVKLGDSEQNLPEIPR